MTYQIIILSQVLSQISYKGQSSLLQYCMEETFRHLSKTCTLKQANDPQSLYVDCQNQLQRLKSQLSIFLEAQRKQHFKVILPNISNLSQEIQNLKENINQQITLQERAAERLSLTQTKQNLLKKIDQHSQKIEKYKKTLQMLIIDKGQLQRQCEENRRIIEQQSESQDLKLSIACSAQEYQKQQIEKDIEKGRKLQSKQISLPSIFSKLTKSIRYTQSQNQVKQSNQAQVDKLLSKMAALYSDSLAQQLIRCARGDNRQLKEIFKGYNTNARLQQFLKDKEVRRELHRLTKKIGK